MNRPVGNLYRGLTAGIVALPPPRAFGVASGPGAAAGLYAVLWVGFFAALTGGAPAQISGPTGPMIVVIAGIASRFVALDPVHGPAMAFTVVTLGGSIQIAFGARGGALTRSASVTVVGLSGYLRQPLLRAEYSAHLRRRGCSRTAAPA